MTRPKRQGQISEKRRESDLLHYAGHEDKSGCVLCAVVYSRLMNEAAERLRKERLSNGVQIVRPSRHPRVY